MSLTSNGLIRLFLPKRGGPWRRWLRVKEAMMDKMYDVHHTLKGPITLFDFTNEHDAYDAQQVDVSGRNRAWRITDDETIGGYSWCQLKLIQTSEEYQQFMQEKKRRETRGDDDDTTTGGSTTTTSSTSDNHDKSSSDDNNNNNNNNIGNMTGICISRPDMDPSNTTTSSQDSSLSSAKAEPRNVVEANDNKADLLPKSDDATEATAISAGTTTTTTGTLQDDGIDKNVGFDDKDEEEEAIIDQTEEEDQVPFVPFIRWWGHIDTRVGLNSAVQRSGFCAIQSPIFPWNGAHVGTKYNALELLFRTDGRDYVFNLKVNTYFPEDLYQAVLPLPPTHPTSDTQPIKLTSTDNITITNQHHNNNQESTTTTASTTTICPKTGGRFDRMVFRFNEHFHHTSRGRIMEEPKKLDGGISIEHVGFVLMDGIDGDFQLDIARIRLVNVTDYGEILGEDDEDAPY